MKTNFKALYRHGGVSLQKRAQPNLKLNYFTSPLDIDLTKLVPELDITASDIVNHQREALVSRKDLAQSTKDFRKLDDTAKLVEFKGLLKGGIIVEQPQKVMN